MKSLFEGYYPYSDAELRSLWKGCILTFDTSTLLNLYRFKNTTRESLFTILQNHRDRIWLSYQAAFEYHRGRVQALTRERGVYSKTRTTITGLLQDLEAPRPPFLQAMAKKRAREALQAFDRELEREEKRLKDWIKEDPVRDRLAELFDDSRVGPEIATSELPTWRNEAQERFTAKTPPGFKDDGKPGEGKYGDFYLWKQILNRASGEKGADVILVLDDEKADWWAFDEDRNRLFPRPELRAEFHRLTGKSFYAYTSTRFLENSARFLGEKIDSEAVKDAAQVAQAVKDATIVGGPGRYDPWAFTDALLPEFRGRMDPSLFAAIGTNSADQMMESLRHLVAPETRALENFRRDADQLYRQYQDLFRPDPSMERFYRDLQVTLGALPGRRTVRDYPRPTVEPEREKPQSTTASSEGEAEESGEKKEEEGASGKGGKTPEE